LRPPRSPPHDLSLPTCMKASNWPDGRVCHVSASIGKETSRPGRLTCPVAHAGSGAPVSERVFRMNLPVSWPRRLARWAGVSLCLRRQHWAPRYYSACRPQAPARPAPLPARRLRRRQGPPPKRRRRPPLLAHLRPPLSKGAAGRSPCGRCSARGPAGQPDLVPWTKFCLRARTPTPSRSASPGKDARIESGHRSRCGHIEPKATEENLRVNSRCACMLASLHPRYRRRQPAGAEPNVKSAFAQWLPWSGLESPRNCSRNMRRGRMWWCRRSTPRAPATLSAALGECVQAY